MNDQEAIVYPVKGKNSPHLGPLSVMVSARPDLDTLIPLLGMNQGSQRDFYLGKLYTSDRIGGGVSLSGPMIGAPYAVMVMETLIAWGAQEIFFCGWCGAVSGNVKIGDIVLPTGSFIDEGTSSHYQQSESLLARPDENIQQRIKQVLDRHGIEFHEGNVWTTDAIFRETREKIKFFQSKGVLSVDMEASALFTVAKFRRVSMGAILVVSDEVSTPIWRPGFKSQRFKKGRVTACEAIREVCQTP